MISDPIASRIVLAARAAPLRRVLRRQKRPGRGFVILDGTLDRPAAGQPYYSGKHRRHDMKLQATTDPNGALLWIPGALPGGFTTQPRHGSGS